MGDYIGFKPTMKETSFYHGRRTTLTNPTPKEKNTLPQGLTEQEREGQVPNMERFFLLHQITVQTNWLTNIF